jgi:hypothetical protein
LRRKSFVEFSSPVQKATIEIFDATGRLLKGATFMQVQKYAGMPVAGLPPGLYILRVKTDSGMLAKKFVKE